MRGRPKRKRFISYKPEITSFRPLGVSHYDKTFEENLTLDEVEAIRLADLEDLDQIDAAKKMHISRITFLRILHSAHQKIANSLIYAKTINMKGGDVIMPNLDGSGPKGTGHRNGRKCNCGCGKGVAECVCPKCGEKITHKKGIPCAETNCPKCSTPMRGVFCIDK